MRMSAPLLARVEPLHVSTHWAASSVPVQLGSALSRVPAAARMWTSAPLSKIPAAMAAPTPKEATSAAVLLDTIGLAKGEKGMLLYKASGLLCNITRIVRYCTYSGKW